MNCRSWIVLTIVSLMFFGCAAPSRNPDESNYRCDGGAAFNVILDTSARTAILRLANTDSVVLPRVPGGPPERYSDGSLTLEQSGDTIRVLRNEQPLLQGCRAAR